MSFASLSELWSAAVERLARLHVVFGAPFAFLSARAELARAERRAILRHLVPLERLVRALLFVMALYEPSPAPPRAAPRRERIRASARLAWPGPDSSAWRGVRFRVLPRATTGRSAKRSAARASVFPRYPLAKRMEAVARVVAAPERWIRRLARWLRARTTAARVVLRPLAVRDPRAPPDLAAASAMLDRALDTS